MYSPQYSTKIYCRGLDILLFQWNREQHLVASQSFCRTSKLYSGGSDRSRRWLQEMPSTFEKSKSSILGWFPREVRRDLQFERWNKHCHHSDHLSGCSKHKHRCNLSFEEYLNQNSSISKCTNFASWSFCWLILLWNPFPLFNNTWCNQSFRWCLWEISRESPGFQDRIKSLIAFGLASSCRFLGSLRCLLRTRRHPIWTDLSSQDYSHKHW